MQAAGISPGHVSQLVGASFYTLKRLPDQFPVGAHMGGNRLMLLSPSLSFSQVNDEDLKIK